MSDNVSNDWLFAGDYQHLQGQKILHSSFGKSIGRFKAKT